jgi:hypothetical protein
MCSTLLCQRFSLFSVEGERAGARGLLLSIALVSAHP